MAHARAAPAMPSEPHTTEATPRRWFRRRLLPLLAAVLLAVAVSVGLVGSRAAGTDGSGPARDGVGDGAQSVGGAGPLGAAVIAERAAASLARRGEAIAMQDLAGALSEATVDGGSPIAVVIAPTALRDAPEGEVVEHLRMETEFGSPRVHAIAGHEGRWLEVIAAELPNGETGWIRAEDVEVHRVQHSLHASLDERQLEVRDGGRVVRTMPIAVGAPETPTPEGTFAVTDKLRMAEEGSPYGCCLLAFTGQQPHVPQGWAGGDRLAVHATPDPATIGQAASLGCFRASDGDMRWLLDEVPLGTPVTVDG